MGGKNHPKIPPGALATVTAAPGEDGPEGTSLSLTWLIRGRCGGAQPLGVFASRNGFLGVGGTKSFHRGD